MQRTLMRENSDKVLLDLDEISDNTSLKLGEGEVDPPLIYASGKVSLFSEETVESISLNLSLKSSGRYKHCAAIELVRALAPPPPRTFL